MERFIIFGGEQFYPRGGANDIIGTRTMEDEAVGLANSVFRKKLKVYDPEFDETFTTQNILWVQVLDTKTGETVYEDGEICGRDWKFILEQGNTGLNPVLTEGE